MRVMRSQLFIPGNKEKMMVKISSLGADVVILDLEDGVPHKEKEKARQVIASVLDTYENSRPYIYVRVGGLDLKTQKTDLAAVVSPRLDGVLLPKVEQPDQVRDAASILQDLEMARGLTAGKIKLTATVETAKGLLRSFEMAMASDRIEAISLGAEDFTLSLGTSRSRSGQELWYARAHIVASAAAAGIQAIDTVFSDLNDEEGLAEESKFVRQLGFSGKYVIHPRQIALVNQVFSPSESEIEYARKVVDAFGEASKNGIAVITVDAKMVDPPVVERAKRVIDLINHIKTPCE